jgi:glycosyltransferase involved in cell wall biosynthesis
MIKVIRVTTVPQSLNVFCRGMLKELSEKYEVIGLASPGDALEEVAEREGVRTIAVPMERHISLLKDIVSLYRLIKVFIKEQPTIVHSMTPKAGLLCMMASWFTRVPVRVHTFTGLVFPTSTGLKRKILMFTDKLTCACATHIIPEGEGVKNDLLNNRITNKPINVLGYGNVRGVDMDYYSRRPEVMGLAINLRDDSMFSFVFVGRIVRDKGINELVGAFDRLSQLFSSVRLFLVGPKEDYLDPLEKRTIERIDNCNSIIAVGRKTGDELLSYYAASDCFVFPSYREGFPNTVLEAGAMGLPSIVTDINGSREIVIEGYNGLIVPSRNEDALFEAMKLVVENNDKRNEMASVARAHIASHYEQSFVRQCLYDFYKQIL